MFFSKKQYSWSFEQVKKIIIRRIGKGNPSKWLNKDYETLSFEIKSKTNVLISPSTLKRIFGKNKTPDKYYPQKATLNALTDYAKSFGSEQKINSKFLSLKAMLAYSIFILVVLSFIFYTPENGPLNEEVSLTIEKIEGTTPASVFFEYNIPDTEDSLYIEFGDDRKSEQLDPEENRITYCYRYPGILKAKIMRGNEVVSNVVDVIIRTDGWRSYTYYYWTPHEKRFFYPIPVDKASNNGVFYPASDLLNSLGIDTTQTIMMQLANFSKTESNGDSFHFKTRLKEVGFWPGTQCHFVFIEVAGRKDRVQVMFTSKGCSHWNLLEFSEKHYEGKSLDLSDFILNENEWKEISITNKNKNVEVFLNDNSIYKETYENSIGDLAGVSIIFLANGYIDYVKLYDSDNNLVMGNEF